MPDHSLAGPLAHWNFNNFLNGQQIIQSSSGAATMDLSDWDSTDITSNGGGLNSNLLASDVEGNALVLFHQRNNGKRIDFHFSMRGESYLAVTYGVKGFTTGGTFSTYRWLVSIDGQNFTEVSVESTPTQNTKRRLHLSDFTELNGAENVTLRLVVDGGTADSNRIKFDNIHINTLKFSAVPLTVSDPLFPTDDAFVRAGSYATATYGTADQLWCKQNGNGSSVTRQSFLKFDVTSAPINYQNVYLRLTSTSAPSLGSARTHLHTLSDYGWSESSVTWNTRPGVGLELANWVPEAFTEFEVDVTAEVASAIGSSGFIGFALLSNGNHSTSYASKEYADSSMRPHLVFSGPIPIETFVYSAADDATVRCRYV